eukprot:TRINITY_DN38878_c0_g1_i1.p1 TRINITY_DN38878_c0_g1~~TRINITY_DN38878_c0_g1_i1.p1  ORF type:complete len:321 (-),score=64.74 TRINITY_DN38878_c0_g1_i1:7-969(-)
MAAGPPDLDLDLPPGVELKWLTPTTDDDFALPLGALCLAVLAAALCMSCLFGILFGAPRKATSGLLSGKLARVALVVAHPDDEAMFFWPTLLRLQAAGVPLAVLCLSTGNFDGLGATRAAEMRRSCARVGVEGPDLVILDEDALQDGWHAWPTDVVAERVAAFVEERRASVVLTFDDRGVSGHPNHVSTSAGVQSAYRASLSNKCSSRFEVLMLNSVGLCSKYVGPLTLMPGMGADADGDSAIQAACTYANPLACLRALAVHWSQLVWYRVLFVVFSRYSYENTYVRYADAGSSAASAPTAATEEELAPCDAASGTLRRR